MKLFGRKSKKVTNEINMAPVQAVGVALSVQMGDKTMSECQLKAVDMINHLNNMGFEVIKKRKLTYDTYEGQEIHASKSKEKYGKKV